MSAMRSVVITGASTGIGRASALQMDAAGWRVFAGVRREEDEKALRRAASDRLVPLRLEITDQEQVTAAAEKIAETVGDSGLHGLVNNAGIIVVGPVETLPLADFRRQIEVNLIGHVAVSQALLPLLRQASGRVVFISSIGGRMSYPFGGAYHASKYGLEAVADCLRQEVRQWGIDVSVVEPGAVDTAIWEREEESADRLTASAAHTRLYADSVDRMISLGEKMLLRNANPPELVADTVAHVLSAKRPRNRYLVGLDARFQVLLHRLVPARIFDWVVARSFRI